MPIHWPGKDCINLFSSALVENLCGLHVWAWALLQPIHPKHLWAQEAGLTSIGLLSPKRTVQSWGPRRPDSPATAQLLWQRGPGPLLEAAPIHCPSVPPALPHPLHHCFHTGIVLSSIPTFLTWVGFFKRNYHLDTKMSFTTMYRIKVKYQFSRCFTPKLS